MSKSAATQLREERSRTRKAYTIAQQRAAQAVAGWAIGEIADLERTDDIGAVYDALIKGGPDPSETLHTAITDRVLSDTVGTLMSASEDAGYLYGLAVGLALRRGGGQ